MHRRGGEEEKDGAGIVEKWYGAMSSHVPTAIKKDSL